jgi:hypothetical protein
MTGVVDSIFELKANAKLMKNKHFNAAERLHRLTYWFGVPVIMISVFLGSSFFTDYLDTSVGKAFGAFLGFMSALLVSLQTFMNPKETSNGHRAVGNKYIEVSRRCSHIEAKLNDRLLDMESANAEYESLLNQYFAVNAEAEKLPTNRKDHQYAEAISIKTIKNKAESKDSTSRSS